MAKGRPVDAVGKILAVLETLEAQDRGRVIQAALTLLDDGDTSQFVPRTQTEAPFGFRGNRAREKEYFDAKDPQRKIEELATAARFLEDTENVTSATRSELERVIKAARRNFDSKNFKRDIENARTANLFTRGTGRDSLVLSAYGQNYVDALPNREALQELAKPRGRRRGRSKAANAPINKSRK